MDTHDGIDLNYVDDLPFPNQRARTREVQKLVDIDPGQWTEQLAREWIEATGLPAQRVHEWRESGWKVGDVKTVHIVGDRADAVGWRDLGIPGAVAAAYVEARIPLAEAEELEATGNRPSSTQLGLLAGFNLADNQKWRDNWEKSLEQPDLTI